MRWAQPPRNWGPNVAALVVVLHTELGMPLEKATRVLRNEFGLPLTKGALVQLAAPYRRGGARVCGAARADPPQSGGHAG